MTMQPILKEEALAAYGDVGTELAKALGITPSAVYQWEDGKPIPNEQALKLRFVLKPTFFGAKPPRHKAKVA
jgi:plasmid maintenance system antidote protein VapI